MSLALILAGCGGGGPDWLQFDGDASPNEQTAEQRVAVAGDDERFTRYDADGNRETIWDLFDARNDPNTTVEVNKYIWLAAQDVLDFMPIESVDPFTGVLVYGYGTAPGSSRAYRATVFVQDPALDARSIKVALSTRSGAAPRATARAIEDAILTRARQLRIQDSNL